jgi:hypothetical protein
LRPATLTDGTAITLLDVPEYDPHWRMPWILEQPRRLPAGTRIESGWTVANTSQNPRNPFVPVAQFVTARPTGALATLLHAAATDETDDRALVRWHVALMQARQRVGPPQKQNLPSVSPEP